jgi:hypothetical protein
MKGEREKLNIHKQKIPSGKPGIEIRVHLPFLYSINVPCIRKK